MGGTGFKEIEKFNDALLAKQVWRMINNPNSLCHRVFKARFFPTCSILEAKDSNTGSYAWKSILSVRDVIQKGMVWRIGNGHDVRIKEDRWLQGSPTSPIISPLPTVAAETKVQTLINPELGVWRDDCVNQLFLPQEASAILGIPLSCRCPPDKIAWGCTPSGVFSTSSAYKLLASGVDDSQAETLNRAAQKQFWKAVIDDYRKEVFSIAAWLLWNQRNAIHFGRPMRDTDQILPSAGNLLQDFLAVQQIETTIPTSLASQHWSKPDLNYHKVNFDAAMFRDGHLAGVGVVVRDWRGEFVGALSSPMPLTHSVADMEALACRKAVEFVAEIGVQRVIFEGDSAMVINALNQNNASLSSYGVVIEDIRSQALVFQSCAFAHTSPVCNYVADAIAKKAKAYRSARVWFNSPLEDIVSLLLFDVH
ncbi:uncharacterized protein LOC142612360 [Castanea sativa]|uniref:uncharacterized protein LOC142612360 n=1 Tax=Castanea sativa TaxID=21020 RepID=UPI003F64DD41